MKTDPNIWCRFCGQRDMLILEENHMIPKYLGGTDKDGRIWLCKPCHDVFHIDLNEWVKEYIKKRKRFPSPYDTRNS